MREIFIIADVETTGRSPEKGSLLSIGAVSFDRAHPAGPGEFYQALDYSFAEDGFDQGTLDWWEKVRKDSPGGALAYAAAFFDPTRMRQERAMNEFALWVRAEKKKALADEAIFVSSPSNFDKAWLDAYFVRYGIENPFHHRALDVRSMLMGQALNSDLAQAVNFTDFDRGRVCDLFGLDVNAHTHNALDDAKLLAQIVRKIFEGRLRNEETERTGSGLEGAFSSRVGGERFVEGGPGGDPQDEQGTDRIGQEA